jgi:hypothetical protein
VWLKKLQARCVLVSDPSQACNGTVISAAAEYAFSSASDAVIECETGGSIRLALIAVLGFIAIPIPFLLLCVDVDLAHTQATAFARKYGVTSPSSPVVSIDHGVGREGISVGDGGNIDNCSANQVEGAALELSINVPDNSAALADSSLQGQSN